MNNRTTRHRALFALFPAMSHYCTRLHAAIHAKGTPVLVGLDPRFDQLPQPVLKAAQERSGSDRASQMAAAYEEFCLRIIDVVSSLVPAVKPQAAFFEELGPPGCAVLQRVIRRARDAGLIVICDAKRGDIGSTAEAYARGYLSGTDPDAAPWAADALTVNPYLGRDTLEPFVQTAVERGAGVYVLVRTSNPGAGTLQDRTSDSLPLYRHVAQMVEELAAETMPADEPSPVRGRPFTTGLSSSFGAVGAVVGATWPQELAELRSVMPHAPFLVPGYGSQGGGAAEVAAAFRPNGLGALVNSSRGIIFAHSRSPYADQFGPDQWERAVEAATRHMIADLAAHTPAGQLQPGP